MNTLKKIILCLMNPPEIHQAEDEKPKEETPKQEAPINYISMQSRVDEMAKINDSIKEIDRFITDLQMYQKNQHEGTIDIKYNDMQGKEKVITFWIDGDFSGDSFSADILQDLFNERDRRRERLCELMNNPCPTE